MSDYTDEALEQALGDAADMGRGLGQGIDLRGGLPGMDEIQQAFWAPAPQSQTPSVPAMAADAVSGAGAPTPQQLPAAPAASVPGAQGPTGVAPLAPPVPNIGTSPSGIIPPQVQAAQAAANAASGIPSPGGPAPLPGPATAKAPGMDDVEGANAQVDKLEQRAQDLGMQAAKAGYDAKAAEAGRLTDAAGQQLTEIDKANQEYHTQRAQNEALADKETHAWMERWDQATREQPDPGHYWHGEGGGLRRALWFTAIAAQAIANRKHPERANIMLQMARQEVDADVQRQKDAISAKRQGLLVQRDMMQHTQDRRSKDMMEDREMKLARVQSLGRYLEARAQAPGPEDLRAAYASMAAHWGDHAAKLAVDYRKEALESRNKVLDRDHQEKMTRYTQGQENWRQKQGFIQQTSERKATEQFTTEERLGKEAFDAGMKDIAVKTAGAEAKAKREAEQTELDPRLTGLSIYNRKTGKSRNIVVDKEAQGKAMAEATAAANEYKDYQTLAKAADSDSELTRLLQTDPAARAAAIKIAARHTKADFSRTTEVEFEKELAAGGGDFAAGSRGRELVSWLTGNKDVVRDFIKKEGRDFQADVGRRIAGNYNVNGLLGPDEEVQFNPPNVEGQEPKAPTSDELLTRAGVDVPGIKEPKTVKEYDAARDAGKLPPVSDATSKAIEDVENLTGWHSRATGDTKAGLTSFTISDLGDKIEENLKAGKPVFEGTPPVPEKDREAARQRLQLTIDRDLAEARRHEENLILNPTNNSHDRFMKNAEREGFDLQNEKVKADLERMFELSRDPKYVEIISKMRDDAYWKNK